MQLYAHWLDGEVIKLATAMSTEAESPTSHAKRLLKLMALLGFEVTLTDVQILDSLPIMECFSDPGFREYISADDAFMRLRAAPLFKRGDERWSVALAALERCKADDWVSSVFPSPIVTKDLAKAVEEEMRLDPQSQLEQGQQGPVANWYARWSLDQPPRLLQGMLYSLHHFAVAAPTRNVSARPAEIPWTNFLTILQEATQQTAMEEKDLTIAGLALSFINDRVEPEKRHTRSALYRKLDTAAWPHTHRQIWHTAVLAWNCANQRNMGISAGSLTDLPMSARVGSYLDPVSDIVFAVQPSSQRIATPVAITERLFHHLPWDPLRVQWKQIVKVVDATSESRRDLQNAIQGKSEHDVGDALEAHISAMASHVAPQVDHLMSPYVWIFAVGAVNIALQVGGTDPLTRILVNSGLAAGQQALHKGANRMSRWLCARTIRKMSQPLVRAALPRPH